MRWLLVLAAVVGCKKEAPPAKAELPIMTAAEVKRSQDACKDYVAKVCACAEQQPALKDACGLARALPEAVDVSLSVGSNPESTRRDVLQANDSVRKVVKECIEELAKLPAQGCR